MDTLNPTSPATVTPLKQAYANTAAARAVLTDEALLRPNVDARRAATVAMSGYEAAEALLESAATKLPASDLGLVRAIPERADALLFAQTVVDSEARDARVIETLYAEALELRTQLGDDLEVAARRGVVSGRRLAEVSKLVGFRNVASDLGILVRVARDAESMLVGRSHITGEQLDRAERVIAALWHAISQNERPVGNTTAASLERRRALTLLDDSYEELRRIVSYLRWDEGDAERITPQLYTPQASRTVNRDATDTDAAAPETGIAPEVAAPIPTASTAHVGLAPGRPDEDPFEF